MVKEENWKDIKKTGNWKKTRSKQRSNIARERKMMWRRGKKGIKEPKQRKGRTKEIGEGKKEMGGKEEKEKRRDNN